MSVPALERPVMTQAGVLVPGRIRFAWFGFRTRDTERCGFRSRRADGAIGESNVRFRCSFRSGMAQ
jgi:hypothetical protein